MLFFSDALSHGVYLGTVWGWENGKTKNLLVLFVLKHDWDLGYGFSYAKSDED